MITSRRSLFGFGAALIAAPAIVRVASIMPVSVPKPMVLPGVYAGAAPPSFAAGLGSFYVRFDAMGDLYVYGPSGWVQCGSNGASA